MGTILLIISTYFNIIQFVSNNTRASSACKFKCTFPRSSLNSIHFFYFNRVVRIWNSLPIINLSLSSSTIKKLIKNFLWQHFLSTFNPHNTCSWFFCCPCHLCLNNSSINFPPSTTTAFIHFIQVSYSSCMFSFSQPY